MHRMPSVHAAALDALRLTSLAMPAPIMVAIRAHRMSRSVRLRGRVMAAVTTGVMAVSPRRIKPQDEPASRDVTWAGQEIWSFRDGPQGQARNPYARWWLWIPGSHFVRPGMTE